MLPSLEDKKARVKMMTRTTTSMTSANTRRVAMIMMTAVMTASLTGGKARVVSGEGSDNGGKYGALRKGKARAATLTMMMVRSLA
jgi:hypothetical protein